VNWHSNRLLPEQTIVVTSLIHPRSPDGTVQVLVALHHIWKLSGVTADDEVGWLRIYVILLSPTRQMLG
jgi:hypothetical protein